MNQKKVAGHHARKRFGQNFLHDTQVINSIAAAIHPQPGDHLLEIGPGLGALTEPVCEQAEHLHVIELDRDLAKRLATHPFINHKLTIHQADAMRFDFTALAAELDGRLKVFGNLPYNISTPLLFHLFSQLEAIESMHFMLQKEVVDRMVAGPGSKTYGKLSVMTQYYCQAIPVLIVPPGAFRPAPKVESAVIRLLPRQPEQHADDVKMLERVLSEAFNQRRKTLRNCLSRVITADNLAALDIDPTLRPERLSLVEFVTISNYVSRNGVPDEC